MPKEQPTTTKSQEINNQKTFQEMTDDEIRQERSGLQEKKFKIQRKLFEIMKRQYPNARYIVLGKERLSVRGDSSYDQTTGALPSPASTVKVLEFDKAEGETKDLIDQYNTADQRWHDGGEELFNVRGNKE